MSDGSNQTIKQKYIQTGSSTNKPPKYSVILHNDDYTPFDFVVEILTVLFNYTNSKAQELATTVHEKGQAVAGTYTHDIAETKAMQIISNAQHNQYPLLATVEPATSDQ